MAVPKRKTSQSKSRSRRAEYLKMNFPIVNSICPNCAEAKYSHTVCPHCGFYKNKIVIQYKKTKSHNKSS